MRTQGFVPSQGTLSLRDALRPIYDASGNRNRLKVVIAPNVSHDWTKPRSLDEIRVEVAAWFNRHLGL
ncbi:MAG TPA: hypothetical protein VGC34_08185 [Steroidobacteraceae bacterium]